MVIKFNTTDYLTYKYIYGLDNLTALLTLQGNKVSQKPFEKFNLLDENNYCDLKRKE